MNTETIKLGFNSIVAVVKANPQIASFTVGLCTGVSLTVAAQKVAPYARRGMSAVRSRAASWTGVSTQETAKAPVNMEIDENGSFVPA